METPTAPRALRLAPRSAPLDLQIADVYFRSLCTHSVRDFVFTSGFLATEPLENTFSRPRLVSACILPTPPPTVACVRLHFELSPRRYSSSIGAINRSYSASTLAFQRSYSREAAATTRSYSAPEDRFFFPIPSDWVLLTGAPHIRFRYLCRARARTGTAYFFAFAFNAASLKVLLNVNRGTFVAGLAGILISWPVSGFFPCGRPAPVSPG